MAVRAHHQQIGATVRSQREQGGADIVAGMGGLLQHFEPHPVAGQVGRDVGAGQVARPAVTGPFEDRQRDLLAGAQQRQGVGDGARGRAAAIPGHQRMLIEVLKGAGIGHQQQRTPAVQRNVFGQLPEQRRAAQARIGLAEHYQVGIARLLHQPDIGLVVAVAPFVADAGGACLVFELVEGQLGLAFEFVEVLLGQRPAERDVHVAVILGSDTSQRTADQVRVFAGRQLDRQGNARRCMRRLVNMHQDGFVGHGVLR